MEQQLSLNDIIEDERVLGKIFLCEKCKKICYNIYISKCGHIFCNHCLLLGTQNYCPTCKRYLKPNDINEGQFLDNFLTIHITCYCVNKSLGCSWRGTIKEYYTKHIHNCILCYNEEDDKIKNAEESLKGDWVNNCIFKVIKPKEENTIDNGITKNKILSENLLKDLQKIITGDYTESEQSIYSNNVQYDSTSYGSKDQQLKVSEITNSNNDDGTITIKAEYASVNDPYVFFFPFCITYTMNIKCELRVLQRDYSKTSIISFGLSEDKNSFHNYFDSIYEDFFSLNEIIVIQYNAQDNTIIISNSKKKISIDKVLPKEDFVKKYYPFIMFTSPINVFELHIYY